LRIDEIPVFVLTKPNQLGAKRKPFATQRFDRVGVGGNLPRARRRLRVCWKTSASRSGWGC